MYGRHTDKQNSVAISRPLRYYVSAEPAHRTLVDASGMIRMHTETHNRSEMVAAAWGALNDTTP
jgi:hypothetical protein